MAGGKGGDYVALTLKPSATTSRRARSPCRRRAFAPE
jgi:hypothetical protein